MEQTVMDRFFQAQKRNDFFINPSKRRKVMNAAPVSPLPLKTPKPSTKGNSRPKSKTRSAKPKVSARHGMTIGDLLNAKPLEVTDEVTSTSDEHNGDTKRKLPRSCKGELHAETRSNEKPVDNQLQPQKGLHETPRRKRTVKVDPWISAQANTILQQRLEDQKMSGKAGLGEQSHTRTNACNQGYGSTLHANNSTQGGPMTSRQSSSALAESPKKSVEKTSNRSSLRKKYGHLLRNPQPKEDNGAIGMPKPMESQDTREFQEPAFRRLKSLAIKEPLPFALPSKFKLLLEQFRCVDSVLFLLEQRLEVCTFERLKKSVEDMSGRNFDLKILGQLKAVFPEGFKFRQEKGLRKTNGSLYNGYQLTIEPVFSTVSRKLGTKKDGSAKLSPTVLITRRAVFESNLIKVVWDHHSNFLSDNNIVIDDKEIRRWHPKFDLDSTPDIKEADLPEPPAVSTITSAEALLSKAVRHVIPQVANALHKVTNQDKKNASFQAEHSTNSAETSITKVQEGQNKLMIGVSQSLLERIREKEKKRHELAMTRNPEDEKEIAMIERLPGITRILKTYFTSEKKCAIAAEDCVQKLVESYGTAVSSVSLHEHLVLLSKLAPEWMQIATVRKCPFVKLTKNIDVNHVLNKLATKKKEAMDK